jgi:hypothetical protein
VQLPTEMTPPDDMSGDVLDQADSIVRDECLRLIAVPVSRYSGDCDCGHHRDVHIHHRKGTDCSQCRCPRYHHPNLFVGLLWALIIEAGITAGSLGAWTIRRWWT